jgi:hypothetical protein
VRVRARQRKNRKEFGAESVTEDTSEIISGDYDEANELKDYMRYPGQYHKGIFELAVPKLKFGNFSALEY